jgi:predicted O-methyltransferase YrrM
MPHRPETPNSSDKTVAPEWAAVDHYLGDLFGLTDPVLEAALALARAEGLPSIQVSALQGRLLHLLALVHGARRILEIGTLGAYSTIWLARSLPPDGRLLTLELDPHHADVARQNIAQAQLSALVEIRVGAAEESLAALVAEHVEPFDLIFIDADKPGYPSYLDWAMKLSRKGTLLIADNVIRQGAITDPSHPDPRVRAVRRFFEALAADPRLVVAPVQMVGSKGYDGWAIAWVR